MSNAKMIKHFLALGKIIRHLLFPASTIGILMVRQKNKEQIPERHLRKKGRGQS
jgi:hypothetical protein